jgi:membrane protease YdiL (CAAX protease family)
MESFENLMPPPVIDAAVLNVAPPRPIKIVRDGILAFIVALGLTVAIVIGIVIVEIIFGTIKLTRSEQFTPTPGFIVGTLVASALPFAIVALFLRWRYQSTGRVIPPLFEGPTSSAILRGVPAGLGLGALGFANAVLSTKLFGEAASDSMREVMSMLASLRNKPAAAAGLVFAIAVLAPLCEELFFRGAIFASVRSTEKMRAAAILSSILFAAGHLNLKMAPYYIVVGLTHCWLTRRTRSLAAPIASHMTVNGLVCLAVLLEPISS